MGIQVAWLVWFVRSLRAVNANLFVVLGQFWLRVANISSFRF
jgi:hypothetical protein